MRRNLENLLPALLLALVVVCAVAFAMPALFLDRPVPFPDANADGAVARVASSEAPFDPALGLKFEMPEFVAEEPAETPPQRILVAEAAPLTPATYVVPAPEAPSEETSDVVEPASPTRYPPETFEPTPDEASYEEISYQAEASEPASETDSFPAVIGQPKLEVKAYVDFDPRDSWSDQSETWYPGRKATWKLVVTNIGDGTAQEVHVIDASGYDFGEDFDLAAGDSRTFEYSTDVASDTDNSYTVACKDAVGRVFSASDDVAALVADTSKLAIKKYVDFDPTDGFSDGSETWYRYETATWRIVVTNEGSTEVTKVRLNDSNGYDLGEPFDLAPGESRTFEYSQVMTGDVRNTARAEAVDELGYQVEAVYDDAGVIVLDRPVTELGVTAGLNMPNRSPVG